jgi:hypothetical protein
MAKLTERFYELLQKLVSEIDRDDVAREVAKLKSEKPAATREELAALLTRRAALKASTTGAAAGAAGGLIAIVAMAPDVMNLVRQQSRLVLAISMIYDREPSAGERAKEVLGTLALSTGAYAARRGLREMVRRGLEKEVAEKVAKKLLGRFIARRLPSLAPIAGTIVGGGVNYLSVRAVGKAAVALYSRP